MPEQSTPMYAVSLVLKPTGWFVYSSPSADQEGKPVSIVQAEEIARVATEATGADAPVTPYMIVKNGTTQLKAAYEAALIEAEEKAKSIPGLRKALGEIS